jgi:hypothetical protein
MSTLRRTRGWYPAVWTHPASSRPRCPSRAPFIASRHVQRAKDIWVNWIVIGLFVSATAAPSASAQDLAQQTTALREIRETVAAICYTVQQQGSQSNAQLSGDIQVKLNSVFSKLGDLGFTGSAQLNMQQYQGVPQQDLASTLRHMCLTSYSKGCCPPWSDFLCRHIRSRHNQIDLRSHRRYLLNRDRSS